MCIAQIYFFTLTLQVLIPKTLYSGQKLAVLVKRKTTETAINTKAKVPVMIFCQ